MIMIIEMIYTTIQKSGVFVLFFFISITVFSVMIPEIILTQLCCLILAFILEIDIICKM